MMTQCQILEEIESKKSQEINALIKPILDKYNLMIDALREEITEEYLIENGWHSKTRYHAGGDNEYMFSKGKMHIRFNIKTNSVLTYYGGPTRSIINKQDLDEYYNG